MPNRNRSVWVAAVTNCSFAASSDPKAPLIAAAISPPGSPPFGAHDGPEE